MTKPFLVAVITGAIIAYLAYPIYGRTTKYIKNKNFASLIVSILVVLLLTVPIIIVLGLVAREAIDTYQALQKQNLATSDVIGQHKLGTNFLMVVCKYESSLVCKGVKSFVSLLPNNNLDYYLQVTIENITGYIIKHFYSFLASIPSTILNIFVMIFVIYYLLKDGDSITKRIKNILPLKESHKQHVLDRFHDVTSAVFYGHILLAIIQGVVGIIGFLILGVPSPILWGFVMMLFALIPYFGTAIVWLPAALNLIFVGYLQSDNSPIIRGVILILYGLLIISSIDNLLRPKLIGSKANVHPILVLLGVLGGLNLFGFIGLILGPLMLALLMTFIDIYEKEKREFEKYF